jgi:ArsR family transcriptional regulator
MEEQKNTENQENPENLDEVYEESADHDQIIESVKAEMPDEDTVFELAELYKIFGDHTRIRILCVLWEHELCVCDIASLLSMTQSAISHQLRVLRASRLIKFRREGKTVTYSLADDHVRVLIECAMEHIRE